MVVRPCWLGFDRCLELGLLVMEQRNRLGRGQELVVDQMGLLAPLYDLRRRGEEVMWKCLLRSLRGRTRGCIEENWRVF